MKVDSFLIDYGAEAKKWDGYEGFINKDMHDGVFVIGKKKDVFVVFWWFYQRLVRVFGDFNLVFKM